MYKQGRPLSYCSEGPRTRVILLSKPMFHAYVFVSDNPVGKVFFEVGSFSQDICLCKAGEARESSIENVVDLVNQI